MTGLIAALSAQDIAARRSSLWWLLSRLVTEQPTSSWLDEVATALSAVDPAPSTPLGPESAALLEAVRRAQADPDGLTALAVDRTRLLAGVLQNNDLAAPYESAVMGQSMNGERASQVAAAYQSAGFEEFAPELGPADYLGTELRFMAVLCYQEMLARQGADPGLPAHWLEHQRDFLHHHLMDWVPTHCDRISQLAATRFYADLARLVAQACRIDCADVDELASVRVIGDSERSANRSESAF